MEINKMMVFIDLHPNGWFVTKSTPLKTPDAEGYLEDRTHEMIKNKKDLITWLVNNIPEGKFK